MYFLIHSSAVAAMANVPEQVINHRIELTVTTDVSAKKKKCFELIKCNT
jgi:hypothetical protein